MIDRFSARAPGCPAVVDTVGTLIATTHGQDFVAGPGVLQADTQVWQQAFQHAGYVWLIGNNGYTGARIAWTPALHAYFAAHFTLIALPSSYLGLPCPVPTSARGTSRAAGSTSGSPWSPVPSRRCDMSVT